MARSGSRGRTTGAGRRALLASALLASVLLPPPTAGASPPKQQPPAPAPAPAPPKAPAAKVNAVFGSREAPREKVFKDTGSSAFGPETEKAVAAALGWLVRHQSPDGRWDTDGFFQTCRGTICEDPGGPTYDDAVTGLALLAILGSGATPRDAGDLGDALRKGLAHLVSRQDAEGCVGSRETQHFVYNHAIGALALAESAAVSGIDDHRAAAQKAVAFTLACRNPHLAWRYGVRPQDNDTSVTGWMTSQLKVSEWAGLRVPPTVFEGPLTWLDRVTDPELGRAGYTARGNGPARPQELMDKFPAEHSESLTGIAVALRFLCGADVTHPLVAKGLALIRGVTPRSVPSYVDYYYWYWGTMAAFQAGGETWKTWQEPLVKTLLASQRKDERDDRRGSWDPMDPWTADGGRVYSTAILALCLEAPYRTTRFSAVPPDRTTLDLESDPPGARVVLDGSVLGTTPLRGAAMPPGVSELRLLHPAAGDTKVVVDLAPLERTDAGNVGLPSGAVADLAAVAPTVEVHHEGRRISGTAPVRPGKVRLLLSQPRCRTRVLVIDAKKGETVAVDGTALEKVTDWSKSAVRNLSAPPAWTGPRPAPGGGVKDYEGRLYCEKDGSEMVVVPGRLPAGEGAKPEPPFLIDRFEVTAEQYRKFCTETRRRPPKPPAGTGDDHPVVGITCRDAGDYAIWAGKRLPSAAEWQRAAYGNLAEEMGYEAPTYPWGQFDSVAARLLPEGGKAAPRPEKVGSFPAGMSPCGALDMVGNAAEWCTPLLREGKPVTWYLLGGSWMEGNGDRRLSADSPLSDAGFRCAMNLK